MKRLIQISSLVALLLSLNSCGLPAALGRSAGRALQGAGNVANSVMGTGG